MRGLVIIGRILLSLVFILLALSIVVNWEVTLQGLNAMLNYWNVMTSKPGHQNAFFLSLLSVAPFLLALAVVLQFIGGFLIFFGIQVRFGALLLLIFLVPVTIIYHHFWFLTGMEFGQQFMEFFKNLALMGVMLWIIGAPRKRILS